MSGTTLSFEVVRCTPFGSLIAENPKVIETAFITTENRLYFDLEDELKTCFTFRETEMI